MIKLFSKLKGWAFADEGFINQKLRKNYFKRVTSVNLHPAEHEVPSLILQIIVRIMN